MDYYILYDEQRNKRSQKNYVFITEKPEKL